MTDKRKRAAPTIDLKATEVPEPKPAPKPAAAEAAPAPGQQETPAPPPPPREGALPPRSETPRPPPPHDFIKVYATPVAAAFAGALIGGAVIWALLPGSSNDGAQIAALQKQMQDLQKRPPPAPDTPAIDALRQRLSKIEHDIANLPPGDATVADRLTAADSAMKSLGIALAALNKRNDDAAANAKDASERAAAAEKAVSDLRASVQSAKQQASAAVDAGQLAAVQQRIGALEQSMKDARAQIAANATTDKVARLALSAASLRDAVERGAPYREELAQAKALGADDSALSPIASFAAGGVPSQQALARELNDLMPALIKAAGVQDTPGGFLERLQANASSLVRISPVNAPPGDTPSAVLARIEVAAAHADIPAAVNAIGKLPEAARQKAADWVGKASARQKALAAARVFASDRARGLVSGSAK
jgi:hypothetical protein